MMAHVCHQSIVIGPPCCKIPQKWPHRWVHEIGTYVQQSDWLDARLNTLVTRPKVLELAREGPTSRTYIASLLIDSLTQSFSFPWINKDAQCGTPSLYKNEATKKDPVSVWTWVIQRISTKCLLLNIHSWGAFTYIGEETAADDHVWVEQGRQGKNSAKLYQIRLCQPRKCLLLLQKLQAICLMILPYIHAIYQSRCFQKSGPLPE